MEYSESNQSAPNYTADRSPASRLMLLFVLLGLLIIILLALTFGPAKRKKDNVKFELTKTEVSQTTIPNGIPNDLPFEANAEVKQNYTAQTTNNQYQATRVYKTVKPLTEALTAYREYFKKNNWEITAEVEQSRYKAVTAKQASRLVQVSVDENEFNKERTISVTYSGPAVTPQQVQQ